MLFSKFLRTSVTRRFVANKKDFYQVLGLPKTATRAEIKKAYARLAQENHPDKNPDPKSQERFAAITEAYQTLNDPKKRENYDNYGMSADEQKEYEKSGMGGMGGFGGFGGAGGWEQQGGFSNFENMFRDFEDFFNFSETAQKKARPSRGADVYVNMTIGFMEAVNGCIKEVSYKIKDECKPCGGTGAKPGTGPVKCGSCNGRGVNTFRQGPMAIQMTCQDCNGAGSTIKHFCGSCRGKGSDYKMLKESVHISKGINSGQNLRVAGKGNKGEHGGGRGDLIVRITVKNDSYFRRDGYDIHVDHEVSVSEAVLGGKVSVRTLDGEKVINVPAGIASSSRIKLANMGVKKLPPNQAQRGDFYVNVIVKIPKSLTDRQREIFEELKALEQGIEPVEKQSDSNPVEAKMESESNEPKPGEEECQETQKKKKSFINRFKNFCN